ncbi:MAG TPA: cysteine--tRNA ligase [Ktedonobacterales bacterium]|nr:cysteine--tRNA ligase [Ktedonobacterales bacterium]
MKLFNTMTQTKEEFTPSGDVVKVYVCGVTPYDTTHLGHAFVYATFDTLNRYLEYRGYRVRYVQNVTDIDDDILRKAPQVGLTWDELGRRETQRFLEDLTALNVRMPDVYAKATEETPRMIELIEKLIEGGHAYVREGHVYFSVKSDPGFGKLAEAAGYLGYESWLKTANERGNYPDDPLKADPLDFVLWQAQKPGEPAWPSPWGPGRPGWHIECSAMSTRYLGDQLDIHGGGADLVFPHHTCEIAQSENATGVQPFTRYWMHIGMVRLDGEKMSKSLGNLVLARNLLGAYAPNTVRVILLNHHYRESWEYQEEEALQAAQIATRLYAATAPRVVGKKERAAGLAQAEDSSAEVAEMARRHFVTAMEDDLDTPLALNTLTALADHILEARQQKREETAAIQTLRELGGVLGLRLPDA